VGEKKHYFREAVSDDVPADVYMAAHRMRWHVQKDLGLERFQIKWLKRESPGVGEVEHALERVSKALGCSSKHRPASEEFDHEIHGRAKARTFDHIWVRADIPREEVIKTVAHEARHLWQWKTGRYSQLAFRTAPGQLTDSEAERDAHEYERRAYAEVCGAH
jgi:hypothetical protein